MKKLIVCSVIALSTASFGQTTCNEVPVSGPEVLASCESAQSYLMTHVPASITADVTSNGVFQLTVNCAGAVEAVLYQNGALNDAQAAEMIDVINDLTFVPATNGGAVVRSFVSISVKITAGEPSCAVHQ